MTFTSSPPSKEAKLAITAKEVRSNLQGTRSVFVCMVCVQHDEKRKPSVHKGFEESNPWRLQL